MSIPGAFAPSPSESADDSDASFNSGDLAHLEGIAAMSESDPDPDFESALDDDDDDALLVDDDGDDEDQDAGEDEEGGEEPAAGGDNRPQLRIGINPLTRSVVLIEDNGNQRPLRANDLIGTGVSLGAIRNMLLRSLGRRGGAAALFDDDEEEDDEDGGMMGDGDDEEYGCATFSPLPYCDSREGPTTVTAVTADAFRGPCAGRARAPSSTTRSSQSRKRTA